MKNVMILTGAGESGMAIVRRMGYGMKIFIGDKRMENARIVSEIMNEAGFDTEALEMDLSSRESIRNLIAEARKEGPITMLVKRCRCFTQPGAHRSHPEGGLIRNCRTAGGGGKDPLT